MKKKYLCFDVIWVISKYTSATSSATLWLCIQVQTTHWLCIYPGTNAGLRGQPQPLTSLQTRDHEPMLALCCADVVDGRPTLNQHLFDVSCLQGCYQKCMICYIMQRLRVMKRTATARKTTRPRPPIYRYIYIGRLSRLKIS